MRGKAQRIAAAVQGLRITPAYAGKSEAPYGCTIEAKGSPPRMRGKAVGTCAWYLLDGITPAYAGKRLNFGGFLKTIWDHPRVCGEKR